MIGFGSVSHDDLRAGGAATSTLAAVGDAPTLKRMSRAHAPATSVARSRITAVRVAASADARNEIVTKVSSKRRGRNRFGPRADWR